MPSVLAAAAAAALGTRLECWMSKRETSCLSHDGQEKTKGNASQTLCDLLSADWMRLCLAKGQMRLSLVFCPPAKP